MPHLARLNTRLAGRAYRRDTERCRSGLMPAPNGMDIMQPTVYSCSCITFIVSLT